MTTVPKLSQFAGAGRKTEGEGLIVVANAHLPALTAQDVGREIYHGRQKMVRIVGDNRSLKKIAWIFDRTPDMFSVQVRPASLLVRRARPGHARAYRC